ncbi:unnamed protein product [Brassicogethes aeneus]|uniref:Uncharacterized protein n=1 Tax=Brassicogethes aeneus TaxID=1431903 RepID=A0A9P0BET7_BRAAE|nr:unnamed protein product [Brassicogethes aeneus]
MEEKTWTVVQFLDDGTVEAVSSSWIQGDLCHWPSFARQKLNLVIRKWEPLNTCWPTHSVKIFRCATFDDYIKARAKAKVAEETSDLNTDENCDPQKRKRVQKIVSSSEESINGSVLEQPPKIKLFRKNKNQKSTVRKFLGTFLMMIIISNPNDKDKQIKTLIQQNHILRGLITDTLHEVKEIKQIMLNGNAKENKNRKTSLFQNEQIKFPIGEDEDFQKLESLLENEEEFLNANEERFQRAWLFNLARLKGRMNVRRLAQLLL